MSEQIDTTWSEAGGSWVYRDRNPPKPYLSFFTWRSLFINFPTDGQNLDPAPASVIFFSSSHCTGQRCLDLEER